MDCSACARGDGFKNKNLLAGPGPAAAAHKGQSMPVDTLMSAPSSPAMTSFIPPAAEQTICMSAGWTMGEAVATPMKNANQTSTRRAAVLEFLNAFMGKLSQTRNAGYRPCSNCAATATAITSGSLPSMPGTPIGQVTWASSSVVKPRASSRCLKLAHLVWLPISPM